MDDLKLIKTHYGENMMHLCRELFPTLLETPGLLYTIIESHFAKSKLLYDDIIENSYVEHFKDFIYSKADRERYRLHPNIKSPEELLDEAGYILYECHSEEDIQEFKKYYARGEELCTFNGDRLDRCHVFFAVKKNVDEIKRENFKNPERQDEYGTSVISIQFTRGKTNTLSIKNRYNHTVRNPDATFANNLDNIIEGLTDAFGSEYGLNINSIPIEYELDGYVLANDGKYYKYNCEENNIYYCPNNIIIDNFKVSKYDTSRYIVIDKYIFDMKDKKVQIYNKDITGDSFTDSISNIEKIEVLNNKQENTKEIIINNTIHITLDKANQMIKYVNPEVKVINDYFLDDNPTIEEIDLPNVEVIKDSFLSNNSSIKKINLPKVKKIGNSFLFDNEDLNEINLPEVKEIGDDFLFSNASLDSISLPNVEYINECFIASNSGIKNVFLPNVKVIGNGFLGFCTEMEEIDLPNAKFIGDGFLHDDDKLKQINIPKVITIGNEFVYLNAGLEEIDLPNVTSIGSGFLYADYKLKKLNLPNVKIIGNNFIAANTEMEEIDLPNVDRIGSNFLYSNKKVHTFNAPKLTEIGFYALEQNESLKNIYTPNLDIPRYYRGEINKEIYRVVQENKGEDENEKSKGNKNR